MSLSIGYFADGPWSHETFNKLINDDEIKISFICARYNSKDQTLKNYAEKHKIDFLKHKNVNSHEFISLIEKYNSAKNIYENFDIDNYKDFNNSRIFFKNKKKFQKYFLCKNL